MIDEALLSRIEDAGLNASAPPQQRWLDGWIVRLSPGKAKRARCINAVAAGRLPLDQKLDLAQQFYREAGLPMFLRVTPFSLPGQLDAELELRGMRRIDDTRVMVCRSLADVHANALPRGLSLHRVSHEPFAHAVGELRGSPLAQRQAHAQRLTLSPVQFEGHLIRREDDGRVLACGQFAIEGGLAGLYDVYTAVDERDRGLAKGLCRALLAFARQRGACVGYLQVEGDNHAARSVYHRLGFADAYSYHYRTPDPGAH